MCQIAVAVVAPDQLRAPLTRITPIVVAVVSVFGAAAAVTPSIVRQVIAALEPDGRGMPLAVLASILTGSAGLGAVVLTVALGRLGVRVGVGNALAFGVTLGAGAAMTYSFLVILTTCALWFVRIGNIILVFGDMYEAARWPVAICPGWLRTVLTVVIPVAFAVTVPAEALAGRLTGTTLLLAVVLAALYIGVARWFWLRGMGQYSGASA